VDYDNSEIGMELVISKPYYIEEYSPYSMIETITESASQMIYTYGREPSSLMLLGG